jgi:methionyl-tRNA formyltransferase
VLEKGRLAVRCGDGVLLELLEVQPASKKAMPASAFLNGLGDRALVLSDSTR